MNKRNMFCRVICGLLAVLMFATAAIAPVAMAEETDSSVAQPTPTPAPKPDEPSGDGPFITAYTVQTVAGQELQTIEPGQKCQIVIGIFDGRFNENYKPKQTDGAGNIVNVKLTSTASFASPSLGDIYCTTPVYSADGVRYSVVFNDIAYLGGDNELSFDLSYVDQSVMLKNLPVSISQCSAGASGAGSAAIKPTVMVQSASYGDGPVDAGEVFTLTIVSYNTSTTAGLSNVVTTLKLPESLTIAGGTNSVMTQAVPAGGSFSNQFQLMAQPGAETGIANVGVSYTYYTAASSEQLASEQLIAVSVVQPDRFSFSAMDVPTEMYTGEENTISLGFVNKGKGILYNLSAEISGNLQTPGQSQYLGNLQPGSEGSVDFIVSSSEVGTVSGVITITYEDITGKQTTQTKEYAVEMLEYVDPWANEDFSEEPIIMEEPEPAVPGWAWGLGAVAVIAAAVFGVKFIKKKKAEKQQLLEDDDEDN